MNTPDELEDALLVRFLAGEATPAERAEMARWAAADPARNAELAELRQLWQDAGLLPSPRRVDGMWESLRQAMHTPPADRSRPVPAPRGASGTAPVEAPRRRKWRPGWLLASNIAAMLAAAVLWGTRSTGPADPVGAEMESSREIRTGRGEQMRLQLVDGTAVELAPESTLRLRYVAGGPREVELSGEANFTVTHDATRPFRVRSGNGIAEDIGTRFSVRAYPDDSGVRVVVAEGLVMLRPSAPGDSITLHPGQLGMLDRSGGIETAEVDALAYLAWADDRIYYRQAPLREIADDLERRYDVDISIPDPAVAQTPVTLDLRDATLADVLDAVAVPLRLQSHRSGRTVVLRS